MAEAVLAGVAKSVLQQLASPALKELLLLWNSKKELKRLELTIGSICNVLQDAEERQPREHLVQGWVCRLREAMYEADDLLDEVAARALRKKAIHGNKFIKEVQLFFSKSNPVAFVIETAHRVKDIRESLDSIAKDMGQFNFIPKRLKLEDRQLVRVQRRDKTHSFVHQEDVIGRDKEREEIINMLLAENHHKGFSSVAIVGFGGLGKTTLAQLVYNDERVHRRGTFNVHIWACVKYFSNLEEVLMEIIGSLEEKPEKLGLQQLIKKFIGIITNKKFLLVLDDVWEEDSCNLLKLKSLLADAKSGSRVLITTRSKKAAKCWDAHEPYCDLEVSLISEESAWSLFAKMAFKKEELAKDLELKAMGLEIVRKCGYVPLSIIAIGSLLRHKGEEKKRWLPLVDRKLAKVVVLGLEKTVQTLKISYDDLPTDLKLCFAYCSLFPKAYRFEKDKLVRLWLAQGFLQLGKNPEEVGEEYFFYLVERCFFQAVEVIDEDGYKMYFCRMHDSLHELAKEVAGTEFTIIKGVSNDLEGKTHRHINFDCQLDPSIDYCLLFSESNGLRTLIFSQTVSTTSLSALFASFGMLRTLDLSRIDLEKIPSSIGDLIHMRYLDLSFNSSLQSLPNSICNLLHLQTLNLSWCESLQKLPSNFRELVSLRCLMLKYCTKLTSLPFGMADLTSLISLDRFILHQHYGGLRELSCLDNLCGSLTIELPVAWLHYTEDAVKSNMKMKDKLTGLTIMWDLPAMEDVHWFNGEMPKDNAEEVLEALEPHQNLQYFELQCHGGRTLPTWVPLHQNIKELKIGHSTTMEYMEDRILSGPCFPSLEILTIDGLRRMKGWWRVEANEDNGNLSRVPCFPRVSKVSISSSLRLIGRMPLFGKIEELELEGVDWQLVRQLLVVSINSSQSPGRNRLTVLKLGFISGLRRIPEDWIRHLTALQGLEIRNCKELEWVSRGGLAHLTSLEELKFEGCGRVSLVDEHDERVQREVGGQWKAMNNLRVLEIPVRDAHLSKGLQYLTALERLSISSWEKEQQGGLPWKGLKRLRELTVGFAGGAGLLPMEIQCLTSLEQLVISDCTELSMDWTHFANLKLQSLTFCRVEDVIQPPGSRVSVPRLDLTSLFIKECRDHSQWTHGLPWGSFPTLRILEFSDVSELVRLPDGIQHLTSLQELLLWDCQELGSLPNWMTKLTSLQGLAIEDCSHELMQRCKEETGAYWPLFRHIPQVYVFEHSGPKLCPIVVSPPPGLKPQPEAM